MGDHTFNKPSPNQGVVRNIGRLATEGLPQESGVTEALTEMFGSAVRNELIYAIRHSAGPVGEVVGRAIDWGKKKFQENKDCENYISGIRELAEKGVSGFLFEGKHINGQTIQVAVDASGKLTNTEFKPFIWTNADDPNEEKVQNLLSAAGEKATAELEEFRQTSMKELPARKKLYLDGLQAYTKSIEEDASESGIPSTQLPPAPNFSVADDHNKKIEEARNSIAEDIRLSGPKPSPQIGQSPVSLSGGG